MKEYFGSIKKCLWTLLFMIIIQVGGRISLPSVMYGEIKPNNVLEVFASISAGNANRLTLFSVGLGPYMMALILWSTITMLELDVIKNLSKKESGFILRFLTFIFSVIQSIALYSRFKSNINYNDFFGINHGNIDILLVFILVTGGMIVSYIADLNIAHGVGKQMIIILPGMLANIPAMLVSGQSDSVFLNYRYGMIILAIITVLFIYISVFLYKAEYRINVEQTSMDIGFSNSYIPIKFMASGPLPFMFSISLFAVPQILINIPYLKDTKFLYIITMMFSYNTVYGIITYGVLLVLLAFGFANVNFRVFDISKALRNSGDYIFGVVPGYETEKYIRLKLNNMIIVNIIYLLLVSIPPLIIGLYIPGVSNLSFYFASLFMLIVIVDIIKEDVKYLFAKKNYQLF